MQKLPNEDQLAELAERARYRAKAMAELLGVSARHFRRLLRGCVAVSPRQFLVRLRVTRARRLVLAGLGGKRLAETLGFSNKTHFSRFFKARTGMTVGRYVAVTRGIPGRHG
jgi:AraC-like DNA-binding protein